jgi:hypothetical protein
MISHEVHYRIQKSTPLVPILSHINPGHVYTSYIIKTRWIRPNAVKLKDIYIFYNIGGVGK